MSKKQLIVLTFLVAAVPAAALLVKMLFSLLHLLSDQSKASAVLWVVYVICLLGSAFVALLPLFLWLYYPAAGYAGAAAAAAVPTSGKGGQEHSAGGGQGETSEDEDAADEDDEGEQLFDEDAGESDDDEFDGGFDDDDDQ